MLVVGESVDASYLVRDEKGRVMPYARYRHEELCVPVCLGYRPDPLVELSYLPVEEPYGVQAVVNGHVISEVVEACR